VYGNNSQQAENNNKFKHEQQDEELQIGKTITIKGG
jgi:hypothetical protein